MAKFIHISKIDAAKRQLEIAIGLFLNNSDPVSIHTLALSAHTLLRDLSKQQGLKSLIKDEMYEDVREEQKKRFIKMISEATNFFKHADNDPEKLLKFYIDQTEFFLWDTCRMYYIITKESPPLIRLFNMWFLVKYPKTLLDEKNQKLIINFSKDIPLNWKNRAQFLEWLPFLYSNIGRE